jgi:hypothetical protein
MYESLWKDGLAKGSFNGERMGYLAMFQIDF